VATPQQPILELASRVRDHPMILPITEAEPACADAGNDPAWWDTDTHTHSHNWQCDECTQAVAICRTCPLARRCLELGNQARQPSLIYAGTVFTPAGRVPNCRTCDNPLPVRSGRMPVVHTCSNPCSRRLHRRTAAALRDRSATRAVPVPTTGA
jgi:hypothetical protein